MLYYHNPHQWPWVISFEALAGSCWYFVWCKILVWSFMLYYHNPHQWPWVISSEALAGSCWYFAWCGLKFYAVLSQSTSVTLSYIFWSFSWILLILCLMLDTGLKFYAVLSQSTSVTLSYIFWSFSWILLILCLMWSEVLCCTITIHISDLELYLLKL